MGPMSSRVGPLRLQSLRMFLPFSSPWAFSPSSQLNAEVNYTVANPVSGWRKRYSFRGDYFEVDSPKITSQYSQVVWPAGGLPNVPLPADVVARFDGKVIYITGWEVHPSPEGRGDTVVPPPPILASPSRRLTSGAIPRAAR